MALRIGDTSSLISLGLSANSTISKSSNNKSRCLGVIGTRALIAVGFVSLAFAGVIGFRILNNRASQTLPSSEKLNHFSSSIHLKINQVFEKILKNLPEESPLRSKIRTYDHFDESVRAEVLATLDVLTEKFSISKRFSSLNLRNELRWLYMELSDNEDNALLKNKELQIDDLLNSSTPMINEEKAYLGRGLVSKVYKIKIGKEYYALKEGYVHLDFEFCKLRHPNLMQGYAMIEKTGNEYYLIQEFIPGTTLEDISQILPEYSKGYVSQIASVLLYLRLQNVCWGDIHPGNIMLSEKRAVLIDLGGLHHSENITHLGLCTNISKLLKKRATAFGDDIAKFNAVKDEEAAKNLLEELANRDH